MQLAVPWVGVRKARRECQPSCQSEAATVWALRDRFTKSAERCWFISNRRIHFKAYKISTLGGIPFEGKGWRRQFPHGPFPAPPASGGRFRIGGYEEHWSAPCCATRCFFVRENLMITEAGG